MTIPPPSDAAILPGDGINISLYLTDHEHGAHVDPAHAKPHPLKPAPAKPYSGTLLEVDGTPVCELPAQERKFRAGDEDAYDDEGGYAGKGWDIGGAIEGGDGGGGGGEGEGKHGTVKSSCYVGNGVRAGSFEGQLKVVEKSAERGFEEQLKMVDGLKSIRGGK